MIEHDERRHVLASAKARGILWRILGDFPVPLEG
jgi:hypothetical protein